MKYAYMEVAVVIIQAKERDYMLLISTRSKMATFTLAANYRLLHGTLRFKNNIQG
jgi:hypothetical protein